MEEILLPLTNYSQEDVCRAIFINTEALQIKIANISSLW